MGEDVTNSEIIGSASSTGADLVTDTLIRLGCRHVFNITGLGMHSLAASLYRRRAEIGYLSHVNETNLALMAQGYARQTRSPAFCFVYNASGTALALMSLTTAWADHAPLVLVTSSNSRTTTGRDQYAGIPRSAIEMGTQYTKWSYEVSIPERLPETLARAAAIAAEPPMGPVHISIPADLYDAPVTGAIPRANFGQTRYFADGCADEAGLAEIAKLLTAAELPVLLAGSEVGQLQAVEPLIELAELLGAPVLMEDLPSYLSFPTSHAQYVGGLRANEKLLADASAALAIGVEFTETGAGEEKPYLPPSVPLAALSVDPFHPTKQLWPAIAISGHPRSSVRRLTELVSQAGVAADVHGRRLAVCAELRGQRERKVEAVRALDGDTSPVPAGKLIDEIRRACGQDWTIVQVGSTAGY